MSQPVDEVRVAVVPDFSSFGARTEAGISASLRGVASSVQGSLEQVERQVGEVGRDISNDFGRASTSAQGSLRAISSEARTAFNNVENQAEHAANSITTRLGGAFATIRTGLLTLTVAAGAGLAALTGFGLKSAATLEQTQIAFNSLLGSVDAGTAAFKDLQQFAAVTPFEFPEVAGAAQRFYAFAGTVGLAKDQVDQFLTTLGDVASVTGGGAQALSSVTLAMGQIASAGKVTLDNLNQISEALPGFSGVAAIASATGKSTAEVMQEISSGSLDATTGIQALLAGMAKFPGAAGAMEKQSQTLLGVFSTFKDTFSQALVAGFTPVIPEIKASLTALTPILGGAIAQIAPALGKLVAGLLPILGQLVAAATSILSPLLEGLGEGLKVIADSGALKSLGQSLGTVASALKPLFPLVGQIVVALALALIPVIDELAPIIADLVQPLGDTLYALVPLIPALLQLTAALLRLLEPLILAAAQFTSWFVINELTPMILAVAKAITFAADSVGELADAFHGVDWDQTGDDISGGFSDAWDSVNNFFTGIIDWFDSLPDKIGAALSAFPNLLADLAGQAFDALFQAVGFGLGIVVRMFEELPIILWTMVTNLWSGIVSLTEQGIGLLITGIALFPSMVAAVFTDLWDRAKAIFMAGIDAVVFFVKNLGPSILKWLEGLPDQFVDFGARIMGGLIQGIRNQVGKAVDTVKRAMGDILEGAKSALGIHSPSLAFNTEVGQQIPPGIGEGVQAAMPDLHAMLANATAGMTAPALAGATSGGAAAGGGLGGISIVVNINGSVSTGEATRIGQSIGAGVANQLAQRGIRTTARAV